MTATILAVLLGLLLAFSYLGYRSATVHAERIRRLAGSRNRPTIVADFTTPEGAILMLEDAFRRHDLEAAVAAKDFVVEARLELATESSSGTPTAADVSARAAALETGFRAMMNASWPDYSGVESYFLERRPYDGRGIANLVLVTEASRVAAGAAGRGGYSEQHIVVAQTTQGWRVLNPVTAPQATSA